MPTAKYQEQFINYSIKGEGTSLVLLHGFGEDSRMWSDFAPDLKNFQIITIDLPGFGKSNLANEVSIAGMAESVKAVLDQEQINQCVLIGHSMGGYVTLAFAKKYEAQLIGWGLFHSHPFADTPQKQEGRTKSIEFVKTHGVPIYVKQLMPLLFTKRYAKSNTFILDKMIYYGSQTSIAGITNGLNAMKDRPDNSVVLINSKVPVLFIVGKQDATIPLENSLQQTHLPSVSAIHLFENVAHMGMFEAKKETISAIRDFMAFCNSMTP